MSSPALDWSLCRSFLAVVRHGSLSAAARELGLTQPTVGRHVEQLQADLGVVLFTRSQHGLAATAAAHELLPHAEAMAAAADALVRTASGEAEEARGVIRLTASEIVGAEVLPPILAAFREAHPAVVIELSLSNRTENLLRRDVDIAVRMTRPTQSVLVAKRVGTVGLGLYAHRRYVEAHGAPRDFAGLSGRPVIGFDRDRPGLEGMKIGGAPVTRELFAFRSDSDLAQLAAMRAGFGIGGCQHGVARRDPDLVPVLPDQIRFELEMWVVMHEALRGSRRMRLMFDHLAARLSEYAASS